MSDEFMTYAGFWKRFVACVIDLVVIMLIVSLIGVLFSLFNISLMPNTRTEDISSVTFMFLMVQILLSALCYMILPTLYFVLQEGSRHQATLGKRCLGIKVCDTNGVRLTRWRAAGRLFCKSVSGYTFLIGYVIAGFTARKQALHDFMVDSLVVNAPRTDTLPTATNADAQAQAA